MSSLLLAGPDTGALLLAFAFPPAGDLSRRGASRRSGATHSTFHVSIRSSIVLLLEFRLGADDAHDDTASQARIQTRDSLNQSHNQTHHTSWYNSGSTGREQDSVEESPRPFSRSRMWSQPISPPPVSPIQFKNTSKVLKDLMAHGALGKKDAPVSPRHRDPFPSQASTSCQLPAAARFP